MTVNSRFCLVAVTATALLLATACGYDRPSASPASDSPRTAETASQAADDRETQEKAKVLAAYNDYSEAYIVAAATANFDDSVLPRYVADPLLAELRWALRQQSEQGVVYQGRPTWKAEVSEINLAEQPFTATISDCFDNGSWTAVYKADRRPLPTPSQAQRYVVTSTAKFYDDGRWLITQSKPNRSRTC